MLFNKKISVYIILYYDLDFLHDILSHMYNFVDEIIIVDGPYKYCLDSLISFNLLYNESNKPEELNKILCDYFDKIKYYYNVWENEKEKRIFGYNMCSNEIVLLVDGDEFFVFDFNTIGKFINSDKHVGGFLTYNMNRIDITFNDLNQDTKKFVIFKKQKFTALEHLSYLWLVGVDDLMLKNNNYMYFDNSLGYIYHLTLYRTKKNNIIKYIFYKCLYFYNKNEKCNLLYTDVNDAINKIGLDNVLDVFYHLELPLIGIPPYNETLTKINLIHLNLDKYNKNHMEAYFKGNFIGYKNIISYFYVDLKTNKVTFEFENVKYINITLYQIELNKPSLNNTQITNNNLDNNTLIIDFELLPDDKKLCNVILFNCYQTIDNDLTYKIISIQ